jgi:hypothetical protein
VGGAGVSSVEDAGNQEIRKVSGWITVEVVRIVDELQTMGSGGTKSGCDEAVRTE